MPGAFALLPPRVQAITAVINLERDEARRRYKHDSDQEVGDYVAIHGAS